MKLYKLCIAPPIGEPAGIDWSEWYSSLRAAKRVRSALISANPLLEHQPSGEDFAIIAVTLRPNLTRKQLALACLIGCGYVHSREMVVRPYKRPRRASEGEST